jgi:hypothetical protein
MHYQLSRKTWVLSNRKFHQRMIAILGSLVVLSLLMLVLETTRAQADGVQDPRCDEFRRAAKVLCNTAVAVGCFEGEHEKACNVLEKVWTNHCRPCEGSSPPWLDQATCPCGNAGEVLELYMAIVGDVSTSIFACRVDVANAHILIGTGDEPFPVDPVFELIAGEFGDGIGCIYTATNQDALEEYRVVRSPIPDAEQEACSADIVAVIAQLGGCPTP